MKVCKWCRILEHEHVKTLLTLSAQTENTLVFTFVMMATSETRMIITSTITLPKEAKNIKFDSETNTIRYEYTPTTAPSLQLTGNPIFLVAGVVFAILAVANAVLARRRAIPPPPPPNRGEAKMWLCKPF